MADDSPILTEVGQHEFDTELRRLMACNRLSLHPHPRAMPEEFTYLPDGRPAITRPPLNGVPHAITLYWNTWEIRKSKHREKHLPKGPRERACSNCGCAMTVSKEFGDTWSFRCEACQQVDVWGKQIVGGTKGGGEKERI